jgi:CheY-like chemotaxis protein
MKTLEALADTSPELILLDMNMPGASGQELARVIRQQDAYLSIPSFSCRRKAMSAASAKP